MDLWILVGLVGAALGSLAMTMVRRLSVAETPERIALSFMLWSSAIGLPLAIPQWVWPTPDQWLLLFLIGILATMAQVALTRGYALASLARGAPFDFIRLPASLIIGLVFFAEYPTLLMWCGVGLILIGSAITMAERT
jgi:drug/metabolite transporter (DMT)-like permease